jgi:type IV secretion system protein TrbL
LLKGKGAGAEASGSGAASETASDGRTTSENGAEAENADRWQSSKIGKIGGKVGDVVASGMEKTGKVAQAGASMGVDVMGQSGIGNQGYYDTSHSPQQKKQKHKRQPINDTNGDGVANDIPPEAQAAVEDGAFIA